MRHRDTATTENIYARIRDEDVADRLLDALDPRLAKQAHRTRGWKKLVDTIKGVPEPQQLRARYTVEGVTKSLDAWAKFAGIPKTTLHYGVIVKELSMIDALALGPSMRKKRQIRSERPSTDCETGVKVSVDGAVPIGPGEPPAADPTPQIPAEIAGSSARHRGFEPLTYGSGVRMDPKQLRTLIPSRDRCVTAQ